MYRQPANPMPPSDHATVSHDPARRSFTVRGTPGGIRGELTRLRAGASVANGMRMLAFQLVPVALLCWHRTFATGGSPLAGVVGREEALWLGGFALALAVVVWHGARLLRMWWRDPRRFELASNWLAKLSPACADVTVTLSTPSRVASGETLLSLNTVLEGVAIHAWYRAVFSNDTRSEQVRVEKRYSIGGVRMRRFQKEWQSRTTHAITRDAGVELRATTSTATAAFALLTSATAAGGRPLFEARDGALMARDGDALVHQREDPGPTPAMRSAVEDALVAVADVVGRG